MKKFTMREFGVHDSIPNNAPLLRLTDSAGNKNTINEVIFNAVKGHIIPVYLANGTRLQPVKGANLGVYVVDSTFTLMPDSLVNNLNTNGINSYRMDEEWVLYDQPSKMVVRILCLGPIDPISKLVLFYVKYKDLKKVLNMYTLPPEGNYIYRR